MQADAKPAAPAGGQENAEKGGWSWGALAAMDGVSAHDLPCLRLPAERQPSTRELKTLTHRLRRMLRAHECASAHREGVPRYFHRNH